MPFTYELTTFIARPNGTAPVDPSPEHHAEKVSFLTKFFGARYSEVPALFTKSGVLVSSALTVKAAGIGPETRSKITQPHAQAFLLAPPTNAANGGSMPEVVLNYDNWEESAVAGGNNRFYHFDQNFRGVGCLTIRADDVALPPSWYLSMGLRTSSPIMNNKPVLVVFDDRPDPEPHTRRVWFYIMSTWEPSTLVKVAVERLVIFLKDRKAAIRGSFGRTLASIGDDSYQNASLQTYVQFPAANILDAHVAPNTASFVLVGLPAIKTRLYYLFADEATPVTPTVTTEDLHHAAF